MLELYAEVRAILSFPIFVSLCTSNRRVPSANTYYIALTDHQHSTIGSKSIRSSLQSSEYLLSGFFVYTDYKILEFAGRRALVGVNETCCAPPPPFKHSVA
jgi:hypothetical protein